MVIFSADEADIALGELTPLEEMRGKLAFQSLDDKLLHSVIENDKKVIDQGRLISDAVSQGLGSFTPDMMFQNLVENFQQAKQIYGERLLRQVTGYEIDYIEKNIRIPEFQRLLKQKLKQTLEELKRSGLLNWQYEVTDEGFELAAVVLYAEELEKLWPKGLVGREEQKRRQADGDKAEIRPYRKGSYRDIAVRKSIKTAIRRGRKEIQIEDLRLHERTAKGQCEIIYALDASGSMKGSKITSCKRAGIALAYKAIEEEDKVGLIVFGKEVQRAIAPTSDFTMLVKEITRIRAASETDIAATIRKSAELFSPDDMTKHLILITDAVPTAGDEPEKETLEAVSEARALGITISVVGIDLDEKGKSLGERMVGLGQGRFYVTSADDVDMVVLQDYYSL